MVKAMTARRILILFQLFLRRRWLVGGLVLCAVPGLRAGDNQSSLALDVQPIFDSYCVQCHMLEAPQADLVLEEGEAYSNLVGVKSTQSSQLRVHAGSPEKSYLIDKLRGTQVRGGGFGSGMPLSEGSYRPLAQQDIQTIVNWITGGAQDN